MNSVSQDIRLAFRLLLRQPGFSSIAIVSLALGIGANTAIFTVVDAILLAPLPVYRPSELVAIYTRDQSAVVGLGHLLPMSYPNFKDLRDREGPELEMSAYSVPNPVTLTVTGEPQQAYAELVTGNFFDVLGVSPVRGRFFRSMDDVKPGSHPIIVLSYRCWQDRFGGDAGVIGRVVLVNGSPFTVIGVAPARFNGVNSLFSPDLWAPSMMYEQLLSMSSRSLMNERRALQFFVAARLKPGVGIHEAEARLQSHAAALEREYPLANKDRGIAVRPLTEATILPGFRPMFVLGGTILMTVVAFVLIIACANIANLLLARANARRQELAIRAAMGATRGRLLRQLLTESLVLALCGGTLGLLLALPALKSIWSFRPTFLAQNFVELELNGRVLTFTAVVSILSAVLFGLLPSLRLARAEVTETLKGSDARGAGLSPLRVAFGRTPVVVQVGLSVVALVTAGLFVRSLQTASAARPGFDVQGISVLTVDPHGAGYDAAQAQQFYRAVQERLSSLHGIQSTAWASSPPLTAPSLKTIIRSGQDPSSASGRVIATTIVSGPRYFKTLGVPLVAGRDFEPGDREGTTRVAIVNRVLARELWPNGDPLGRPFRFYTDSFFHTVIGVAETSKYTTLGEDPQPAVYVPLEQNPRDAMTLLVRSVYATQAAIGTVQREIRMLDPSVPLTHPVTMRQVLMESLWAVRLTAAVLGTLGGIGVVLATVGLYGVMSYTIGQRTREIGIRMALGADRRCVLSMVLRQALAVVLVGVGLGGVGALLLYDLASPLLFGIPITDPATFVGIGLVVVTALFASGVPAWRASRLNPALAIR